MLKGKVNYKILPDPRDNFNVARGPSSGSYLVYKHITDALSSGSSAGVQFVTGSASSTESFSNWLFSINTPTNFVISGTQTIDAYRFYKIRITTTGFPSDHSGIGFTVARFSLSYDNGVTYPLTNLIPLISGTSFGDGIFGKFPDQQLIAGTEWTVWYSVNTNAFSVWKFASASIPFYVGLFHFGSPANAYSGSNLTLWGQNNPTEGGLGIAVGQMSNGGNPWTGLSSSSYWDVTSSVYLWPRSNNPGGLHQTNRNNLMPLLLRSDVRNFGVSGHCLFDENNLAILNDVGSDNSYDFFYFGKSMIYTGSGVQYSHGDYTYLCANKFSAGWIFEHLDLGFGVGLYSTLNPPVYGSISGSTILEGGLAVFSGSLKSDTLRQKSGVKGFVFDLPAGLFYRSYYEDFNTPYWPNSMFGSSGTPRIDVWSPSIIAWEYPKCFGTIGYVNWWGAAMQVNTLDSTPDFSRAAFGNSVKYTIKAILPWSTVSPSTGTLQGVKL